MIWDVSDNCTFHSHPYLIFLTADGPGLTHLDGMVGHVGKNGCYVYCGILGQCKEHSSHYYPALLMLHDHCIDSSNHDDFNIFNLPSRGEHDYPGNLARNDD